MIGRRSVLTAMSTGAAGTLIGATGLTPAQAAQEAAAQIPPALLGPRMNFAQAEKVMTQLGLDALIVGSGVNFYHATGLDLTETRMGLAPGVFAIVTRHEDRRLSILAPSFLYYYTMALDLRDQKYPVYLYTAPERPIIEGKELIAAPVTLFKDRGEKPMDEIEVGRADVVKAALAGQPAQPNLTYALRKALKDLGLSKGRIAADLQSVWKTAATAAPEATIVDADDALRRIRPIKSAMEIALMRTAAQANVDAALEAVKTVRAGGSVRDLRASYFGEVGSRGMRGVFMVINRVSSPTYEAQFHDGQCFAIDCVSEYMGYHGDYARAVFVGEPPTSMKKVTKATGQAWDIVRETLKPGVKFSEISATGRNALKKLGVDYSISFGPHSVGLYHHDHTGDSGLPSIGDMVLEPGMVISVDCPLLEAGAGGSSHLEDLTLITANGSEQINDIGHKTITV